MPGKMLVVTDWMQSACIYHISTLCQGLCWMPAARHWGTSTNYGVRHPRLLLPSCLSADQIFHFSDLYFSICKVIRTPTYHKRLLGLLRCRYPWLNLGSLSLRFKWKYSSVISWQSMCSSQWDPGRLSCCSSALQLWAYCPEEVHLYYLTVLQVLSPALALTKHTHTR